jgi:hypothetical protein
MLHYHHESSRMASVLSHFNPVNRFNNAFRSFILAMLSHLYVSLYERSSRLNSRHSFSYSRCTYYNCGSGHRCSYMPFVSFLDVYQGNPWAVSEDCILPHSLHFVSQPSGHSTLYNSWRFKSVLK